MLYSALRRLFRFGSVVCLGLGLAACGGGGGSGGESTGTGPGGGNPGPARLEFFAGSLLASLLAVPPSQPSAFQVVDPDANIAPGSFPVISGDFSGATFSNVHIDAYVYSRVDGTLWRASTDPNPFPPAPVRISTEEDLERICRRSVSPITNTPEAVPIVYALAPEGDTSCAAAFPVPGGTPGGTPGAPASLIWKFVLLGDAAGIAPRPFPTPDLGTGIVNLSDSNLNHAGWLIIQNGDLVRLDAEANVAATIAASINTFSPFPGQLRGNGVVLLNINGGLFAFDPADNSLSDLAFSLGTSLFASTDGQEAYFVVNNSLYRTTGGGAGVVEIDRVTDPFGPPQGPLVGAERVVWRGDDIIRSADKDATGLGTGKTIVADSPIRFKNLIPLASARWIFYNQGDSATLDIDTAVATRMDGSDTVEFANSRWIFDFDGNLGVSFASAGNGFGLIDRIYRIDNFTGGDADSTLNKPLLSVLAEDPGNPDTTIMVGTLPGRFPQILPGFGPGRLMALEIDKPNPTPDGDEDDFEIFYFEDDQPQSLTRVTTDREDQDGLLFGF